jgi:AcrR family transcriptional regulator
LRTGVREIARGAGVTAMLVNRYFGSKVKLFEEAVVDSGRISAARRGGCAACRRDSVAHRRISNDAADDWTSFFVPR